MVVVLLAIVLDGFDKLWHAAKQAEAQPFIFQIAEPSLGEVQTRRTRGREVDLQARMAGQPTLDLLMLVRRVVVDDEMQVEVRWCGGVDPSKHSAGA